MRRTTIAAMISAAMLMTAGAALAQTPKGGATLAGGDNGSHAKAASTRKAMMPKGRSGAPGAHGKGQGTEHRNGKMRAHKNF